MTDLFKLQNNVHIVSGAKNHCIYNLNSRKLYHLDTEKEIVVSAKVKDFEMNGIAINGIRMNLDIDFDDETIQEKIDEVIGAVSDLDEGADKLNEGAADLYDATEKLNTATGELYTGVGNLKSGAGELSDGLSALTSKNEELLGGAWTAYKGLCSAAEKQLNTQLVANGFDKVTLTPSTYSEVLLGLLEKMDADTAYTTAYNTALALLTEEQKTEIRNAYIEKMMASEEIQAQINEAVRKVSEAAAQVSALKGQLDSYGVFYNGLVEYTDAVSSASIGASTLATGLTTLYTNTDTLNTAVGDLHIAVGTLKDGTGELKSGTEEFVSETDGMDTQVSDEIDNITTSMTGKDVETVSFVSKQNTNIKSVQFVIQTEEIEIETAKEVETPEPEKLNFWQKLLKLFGWD